MSDSSPDLGQVVPEKGNVFYHSYEVAEDSARAAYHYEQDPRFFTILNGGEWHVYSCSLWEKGFDITQAQEKKLDRLAELMELKPGMHILDVGCGWGGPLVYLCHKYGVTGHGITVSARQIPFARERAAQYGVDATFEVVHWQDLPEVATYDAIFTDEVMVHFNDLRGFFTKCHHLLQTGRVMVHKELHLSHSRHSQLGPLSEHVNALYGYTGNYVTLHHELALLDETGFQLESVTQIPLDPHYLSTIDAWLTNLFDNRAELKALAGAEMYRRFRIYLKAVRHIFTRTDIMRLHIVTSRKPDWS